MEGDMITKKKIEDLVKRGRKSAGDKTVSIEIIVKVQSGVSTKRHNKKVMTLGNDALRRFGMKNMDMTIGFEGDDFANSTYTAKVLLS